MSNPIKVFIDDIPWSPALVGLSGSQSTLGKAIKASGKVWSKDLKSVVNHAFWITSDYGDTWEQLWTLKERKMEAYIGQRVILGWHEGLPPGEFLRLFKLRKSEAGRWYPPLRLLLFWTPPAFRRLIHIGNLAVCSEESAWFLWMAGLIDGYRGHSPDDWHEWLLYRTPPFHLALDCILVDYPVTYDCDPFSKFPLRPEWKLPGG